MTAIDTPRPKGLALLAVALRSRKAGCMLGLGFSSGLPFALLLGSLNVWLVGCVMPSSSCGLRWWIACRCRCWRASGGLKAGL